MGSHSRNLVLAVVVSALALSGCAGLGEEQSVAEEGGSELTLACVSTGGPADGPGLAPAPQRVTLTRADDALVAEVDLAGAEIRSPSMVGFVLYRYRDDFDSPDLRSTAGMGVMVSVFPEAFQGDPTAVSASVSIPHHSIPTADSTFELTDTGYVLRVDGAALGFDLFAGDEDSPELDLTEVNSFTIGVDRVHCGTGYVGTEEGFTPSGDLACIRFDNGRPEGVDGQSLGSFEVNEDDSVTITRSDDFPDHTEVVTDAPGLGVPLGLNESVTLDRWSEGDPDVPGYRETVMLMSAPVSCSTSYVPSPAW